ncbi:MAG: AMP-binding enzyme [Betaproteobacteria bacterium]
MVVSGGYNVYSRELEQVLLQHPDIVDAAVVGAPDAAYGEAVAAFVLTRPGAALTAEAVIAHCRGRLPTTRSRGMSFLPIRCRATRSARS